MNRLSAASIVVSIIAAASFACSSAVPGPDDGPTAACTNCGSSAVVSEPMPSATVAPPAVKPERPVVLPAAPVALDSGTTPDIDAGVDASAGNGTDDASHVPDAGEACTIIISEEGDSTNFEMHCS